MTVLTRTCATPTCNSEAGHGVRGTFCKPCAKRLAAIRDEYVAEAARMMPSLMNGGKKRQVRQPSCCNPYCQTPRTPPNAFCDACQDAGYTEDEAA